jgi:hypothetical protein
VLVGFGYRCDSCELETLDYCGYSRCMVTLRYCLGIGALSANKPFGYAFLVISLHVIISYTC